MERAGNERGRISAVQDYANVSRRQSFKIAWMERFIEEISTAGACWRQYEGGVGLLILFKTCHVELVSARTTASNHKLQFGMLKMILHGCPQHAQLYPKVHHVCTNEPSHNPYNNKNSANIFNVSGVPNPVTGSQPGTD